jgi:hypothetical protein
MGAAGAAGLTDHHQSKKNVRPGMSRAWNSLWRDPRRAGWLMSAYFLLSLVTGPVIYLRVGPAPLAPGPGAFGWVFSAFFGWRVTRGGRVSRVLLIVGAVLSCLAAASTVALRFTPAVLGVLTAGGVQVAVLLSPAVYQRTRPGGGDVWTGEPTGPQPRRSPRWLVTVLAVAAALGLTGSVVAEAAITGRVASYNSRTVHLRPGQPSRVTLTQGHYFAFVGCADYVGCPPLDPRQLTIRGPGHIVVTNVAFSGPPDMRSEVGQQFQPTLAFTVPTREQVLISLSASPGQPVFVAPSEQESQYLIHWIEVAVASALLLLAALAALDWTLPWRARVRYGPATA